MKYFLAILALSSTLLAEITIPLNFKSNFHQTITNEKGKVIKYEGEVVFKNLQQVLAHPSGATKEYTRSLFKWSYQSPTLKEVCTDGIQLIVIDHDLEQVSHYTIDDGVNLKEILKVAQKISATDYKAVYKEIEYLITLNDKEELEQIVYVDNLDNNVKILFNNMYYNTTVDETILECTPPQEYDLIEG
jgi:outer membrane lipoprotein carrier protein